jgi:manganese oxidase
LLILTAILVLLPAPAQASGDVCSSAVRTIHYDVTAFQLDIPLNGWGDHIQGGLMYALSNADAFPNVDTIRANPQLAEPLTLRAAKGDCIEVRFTNEVPGRRVSMHPSGLALDPKTSGGAAIGLNPDTTVPPGEQRVYRWFAHREGSFVINDYGSGTAYKLPFAGDVLQDTTSLGLFGTVVVLPAGSTWHHPETGANLLSGNQGVGAPVFADVHLPGPGNDFRDLVLVFMDEPQQVKDRDGNDPTYPATGLEDSTFGFNYRSEPLRNRLRAIMEHRGEFVHHPDHVEKGDPVTVTLPNGTVIQPDDHWGDGYVPELDQIVEDPGAKFLGEESHLQSWMFGDPGKLTRILEDGRIVVDSDSVIPKAYAGDPVTVRVVNPGPKESHPFHQHTNRWKQEPEDDSSMRLDVQTVGPGETYDFVYEGGAGEKHKTVGDQVFHCHLYPHFAQGFWGILRVFDRLRHADYGQTYPDGTPIETLMPLPDRADQTLAPDEMHPGFPLFVKGDYLQRAYRPPYAVVNDPFQEIRRPGDTIREGTELERANMALKSDGTANPGVFFVDPCPAGTPERTYHPASIDASIVYNKAGWRDPEGRLYVEAPPGGGSGALQAAESERQKILKGQVQPEPYTIRARLGECVNVRTTNATHLDDDPNVPLDIHANPDGDYFHEASAMSEASTHVHLVRFDELGSDGTSIGWNYVQAPLNGQTYGYRWFVDVALRTVFFHDHQYANTHQQHGLWSVMNVEPADATWHDPKTGERTNGVGTVADIRTPSGPDFREFTVHFSDFVPQVDAAGSPINPPHHPDDYASDQGVMGVNYRNEPFPIRMNSQTSGSKREPAHIFSSAVHGDPSTPLFRAYSGDPAVFRFVTGAHEEGHAFSLAGHRWLSNSDDPKSNLTSTQGATLAEWFNYEVEGANVIKRYSGAERAREASNLVDGPVMFLPQGAGLPGDYLYSSPSMNDLWMGMWGIFRVPATRVADLKPLPDRQGPASGTPGQEWPALRPGQPLAAAPADPGTVCPAAAPKRTYNISLVMQSIVYNASGDHDPSGIAYVLNSDLNAQGRPKAGANLKPLFIRANEGDCLTINLTNRLPGSGVAVHPGDPVNPVENTGMSILVGGVVKQVQAVWPAGNRASLHAAGLARYDVTKSDGSAVGYNFDSTVAPGKTRTYRYYVDTKNIGIVNLENRANIRGTRHHGAWAGLVVEPKGATYHDPVSGVPLLSGENAVISYATPSGVVKFREFIVDVQDGLNLHYRGGGPIPDQATEDGGPADPEDQGEKGINYRSERFLNRLSVVPDVADVFSSVLHGDPVTPLFRAYVGDPVMMRVLNSQDLPRMHTFGVLGHEWRKELNDPNSIITNAQGALTTTRALNLWFLGGAGGPQQMSGDYLYGDRNFDQHLSGGLWGLIRVHDRPQPDLKAIR